MEWFKKFAPALTTLVDYVLGGTLQKYGEVAQTAVRSAVTKTDNGLDELVAIYRKYDASHPLVQMAVTEAQNLLRIAGLKVPEAEDLASHIRAAIHDVASVFVTLDGPSVVDSTSTAQAPQTPHPQV
ncbi:hypothetical protein GS501_02515 [Saccharibacter sp. 17.LH.SD]|uniref:hypothetical protein n=1 Tax=Saccharibacter sp. 17.LH.SD TaxID=2689393 RepID=UPI00136CE125|nr:hypothetical protein [Saccharibacter sp. 17.LH.SD]MXV43926.1 hypothetical protein [Saccharibacter sp. 17.LH.SD]